MKLLSLMLFIQMWVINESYAQQQGHFSNFMLNKYGINNAYAGFDYSLSVTGIYRNQWDGLEGSPASQYINAHLPLYILHGAGGVEILNDELGLESNQTLSASYSYVYNSSVGLIAYGMKLGAHQIRIANNQLIAPDGNYEGQIIQHNDPILSNQLERSISPVYGFSSYYIGNFFELGVSIEDFLGQKSSLGPSKITTAPLLSAYFEIEAYKTEWFNIKPSLMLYSDFVETQINVSVMASMPQNLIGGIGIRGYSKHTFDSMSILLGWRFNEHYTLAYAYDFGISNLRSVHSGSNEIVLKYNLNKRVGIGLPPKIIYNPRDL